jgi:Cu/Ag efflux protein CusF
MAAVSAVLLAMGVAFAAAAAETKDQAQGTADQSAGAVTKQKGGTYDPSKLRTVTVVVKEVDAKAHRVTFEATVKPEATTSSGQPIKLDQLKEGDTIRATFDPKTGEVVKMDVTPGHGK